LLGELLFSSWGKFLDALLVCLIGFCISVLVISNHRVQRQLSHFQSRSQTTEENLRAAIGQGRLVAENLIEALSDEFHSDEQLDWMEQAEAGVKQAIVGDAIREELVSLQRELNDSFEVILAGLSERPHEEGKLVAACLQGWSDTKERIDQATLAYNDAAMTFNEFLRSGIVR
jgi:hypothetical protein